MSEDQTFSSFEEAVTYLRLVNLGEQVTGYLFNVEGLEKKILVTTDPRKVPTNKSVYIGYPFKSIEQGWFNDIIPVRSPIVTDEQLESMFSREVYLGKNAPDNHG